MPELQPFAPHLSFLSLDLEELVEDVRRECFPWLPGPVPVFFVEWSPLACVHVDSSEGGYPAVYFHQVLNHPATPYEVLRGIAKHELLHFVVRPVFTPDPHWPGIRARDSVEAHPPLFWSEEARIAPEMATVWSWIRANLHRCLDRDEWNGIRVTRSWRTIELGPRTPWVDSALQFYVVQGDDRPGKGRRRRRRSRGTPHQPRLLPYSAGAKISARSGRRGGRSQSQAVFSQKPLSVALR